MKATSKFYIFLFYFLFSAFHSAQKISAEIVHKLTIDSLGACQGVFVQGKTIYLYGDREVGVIRKYKFLNNKLYLKRKEVKLSVNGKDLINHPTGIAINPMNGHAFIGNSSRMNEEGTLWKANIFETDWKSLITSQTMDKKFYREIEDGAAIQGTRPVLVKFNGINYVATADYGNKKNQVRLYGISELSHSGNTAEGGVLKYKFDSSPWVQNLFFIEKENILVLVQNQIEGKYWRLTFLDFNTSVKSGKEKVLSVIDFSDPSELEGFAMIDRTTAIAVTSSKTNNVSVLKIKIKK